MRFLEPHRYESSVVLSFLEVPERKYDAVA